MAIAATIQAARRLIQPATKETVTVIIAALIRALGPMFKKKFGSGQDQSGHQAGGSIDGRPM